MQRHRMRGVIEPHLSFHAKGASEDIGSPAGIFAHVVGREAGKPIAT